jgi:hypothetical protein
MESDSSIRLAELRVDGGACANNLLMQFQADVLGVPVVRAANPETGDLRSVNDLGLPGDWWRGNRARERGRACRLNQESDSSCWSRLQRSLASKNDSWASASLLPRLLICSRLRRLRPPQNLVSAYGRSAWASRPRLGTYQPTNTLYSPRLYRRPYSCSTRRSHPDERIESRRCMAKETARGVHVCSTRSIACSASRTEACFEHLPENVC